MKAVDNLKVCSSCRRELDLSAFNKHHRTVDKLQNACKECKAKMTKNWKYGIKSGIYDKMVADQQGKCFICDKSTIDLVIDHDHKTDIIRNLLCRQCNALLGMCNDNINILSNAISYIKHWTEE